MSLRKELVDNYHCLTGSNMLYRKGRGKQKEKEEDRRKELVDNYHCLEDSNIS